MAQTMQRDGSVEASGSGQEIDFNFSGEAFETLAELARRKGTTMSEVLREAIALEKWVVEIQREGGRILVERNGKLHELVKV